LNVSTGSIEEEFSKNFENFQLFYATGENSFSYVYSGNGGEPLRYARYLLIKGVIDEGKELPQDKILKIESHVLFQKGSLTGDKVMESFI
jgi:hypothetical protein